MIKYWKLNIRRYVQSLTWILHPSSGLDLSVMETSGHCALTYALLLSLCALHGYTIMLCGKLI